MTIRKQYTYERIKNTQKLKVENKWKEEKYSKSSKCITIKRKLYQHELSNKLQNDFAVGFRLR